MKLKHEWCFQNLHISVLILKYMQVEWVVKMLRQHLLLEFNAQGPEHCLKIHIGTEQRWKPTLRWLTVLYPWYKHFQNLILKQPSSHAWLPVIVWAVSHASATAANESSGSVVWFTFLCPTDSQKRHVPTNMEKGQMARVNQHRGQALGHTCCGFRALAQFLFNKWPKIKQNKIKVYGCSYSSLGEGLLTQAWRPEVGGLATTQKVRDDGPHL